MPLLKPADPRVMSQLNAVLRRSIAHIDPEDPDSRDRVFTSAREAMIRLLRVYDPPLTGTEIASKIREFDTIVREIHAEFGFDAEAPRFPARLAIGGPTPAAPVPSLALAAPAWARPTDEPEIEAPPERRGEPRIVEPDFEEERTEEDDVDDDPDDNDGYEDDDDAFYDDEAYDEDGYPYEEEPRRGLPGLIDAVGWRMASVAAGILVAVLVLLGGAAYLHSRPTAMTNESVATTAGPVAEASSPPPVEAPAPAPEVAAAPAQPRPAPPPAPVPQGALALETLMLFDGRDPSVFQSAPENPVRFAGDTDGGFAEISSSTGSTGARLLVGRGVYERIAGRTIRIVLVARAAKANPAVNLRFSYQNGRAVSPWAEVTLGPDYAPLSESWTVPKERGGPENDALIIEPGIPGDGTATDIRSVRIEILQ